MESFSTATAEPTSFPPTAEGAGPAERPFVPRVRLYTEPFLIDRGDLLSPHQEVRDIAVLALTFDYGSAHVRASDRSPIVYDEEGRELVERDLREEARLQCLLESFGAIELEQLEDFGPPHESVADYVVHADDNVHAICSFSAHAVPQLERLGFEVDVDETYPYQVLPPQSPWYADLGADSESDGDWFSLELGVEVDGQRINLLPALVEMLEAAPDDSTLRALTRLPAKFRAVKVAENTYLPMAPERLRALLQVLIDLYDGAPSSALPPRFELGRALCLAGLDEVVGDDAPLQLHGQTDAIRRARALVGGAPDTPVRVATALRATLRSYQSEGLAWLQHLRRHGVGGVLADDMGLGKTLQTIAHLALERESGRMNRPSLIVVPTSLVGNWEREIVKFAPHLRTHVFHGPGRHRHPRPLDRYDIVITTYPVLVRDVEKLSCLEPYLVVLDEAQAIKNPRSRAHRSVQKLDAEHRLALTGTPVENNLEELWALFDFVVPGLLGDADGFRTRFRYPIERDGDENQLALLRQRVAPFVLRRTKEQVATELPPKTELVRPVEIRGAQRELYESIRVAAHAQVRGLIRKKGIAASTVAILDALMKLRQLCCDPRLVAVERARKVTESAKFELLFEMLTQQLAQGRRVLIFSQFAKMLALISAELRNRRVSHAVLTGATRHRQAAVDAFQRGKVDVFLISLKAGGTGLNLTRADTVIHYEPWWNPAAQAQATDRAYRIGQTNPVFVHNLIVAGSVEERMLRLQERKKHLADTILGGVTGASALSEEEIDDLFAPLDD